MPLKRQACAGALAEIWREVKMKKKKLEDITEQDVSKMHDKWYKFVRERAGYILIDFEVATHYAFLAGFNTCKGKIECHAKQRPTKQLRHPKRTA